MEISKTSLIILQFTSNETLVGFHGDKEPVLKIKPTVIGYNSSKLANNSNGDYVDEDVNFGNKVFGEMALKRKKFLTLKFPIQMESNNDSQYVIKELDSLKHLFNYIFQEISPDKDVTFSKDKYVMICGNFFQNREKLAELLFEEYEVQGVYYQLSSLYHLKNHYMKKYNQKDTSNVSGLVIELQSIVENNTSFAASMVPIYNGYLLQNDMVSFIVSIENKDSQFNILKNKIFSFLSSFNKNDVSDKDDLLKNIVLIGQVQTGNPLKLKKELKSQYPNSVLHDYSSLSQLLTPFDALSKESASLFKSYKFVSLDEYAKYGNKAIKRKIF